MPLPAHLQDSFGIIGETTLFIMGNSLPPVSCEYGLDGLGPLVLELFIIQFRPGLEL